MATMSPTSPIAQRDMRSASKPFKRDKDHSAKWSVGQRPSSGCFVKFDGYDNGDEVYGGSDIQRAKVRPQKLPSQAYSDAKPRANVTPKHNGTGIYDYGKAIGRIARTNDAHFEARDDILSRSLLELVPDSARRESSAITMADAETFYSFDNKGASPNEYGRTVGLEGLVERAEKKWVSEQTEKIIRGEYEVLDAEGEITSFKKGKKSPKQKANKTQPAHVEDEDGFELI